MIILPIMCFVYLSAILQARVRSRAQAVLSSIILITAVAVTVAELTSLFTAYEIVTVSIAWGLLLSALVFYTYKTEGRLLPRFRCVFGRIEGLSRKERILLIMILGTILFALLKMFIEPPTVPGDATMYHQPRAFMFYKNKSIHNFPTSFGHMLYFGPLNAILISQMQILCFGWDRLSPLAQFSAYIVTILGVYLLTKLLCKSRTLGFIGAAIACFMPMAHLQASTMQSDLMSAGYCVAAVCLMGQLWSDLREQKQISKFKLVLLGLSCGLAVLGKLSAAPTLIGCALLFAIVLLVKYKKRVIQSLLLILLCAVMMTGGFWVRNALDWNGDFLPVSYSGSRPDYEAMGVRGTMLLSAKALATPFSDPAKGAVPPFAVFQKLTMLIADTAASVLNIDVNTPSTQEYLAYITGSVPPTPDQISYPIHAILLLIMLPAAFIFGIVKKKWWLVGYAACCLQALLTTSTQYMWCTSYNRYLMPSYLISVPLCSYMLCMLLGTRRVGKTIIVIILASMFCINAMTSAYFPYKDIVDIFVNKHTPDERVLSEHSYNPLTLWRQVIQDIEDNGYTKLALDGASRGDYIWMRPFADARYEIRYINPTYHVGEARDYAPDCIIACVLKNSLSQTMSYNGVEYIRKFEPCGALYDIEITDHCFEYFVKAE